MSTFDAANSYFSGQGVVMIGKRDPVTGNPIGLRPVGNVSDLKVTVATTVIDHKGSQDGQRAIEARLQTETKATASFTLESWNNQNLAKALRGDYTSIAAGTVTAENITGYPGLVAGFQYIKASSLVLKKGSTSLVAFVDGATPYDYKWNPDANSIMLNDPSVSGLAFATVGLGVAASAIGVGATTTLTVANTAVAGERVWVQGFAGADAAFINNQTYTVVSATSTQIVIALNTTAKTITAGTNGVFFLDETFALNGGYSYAAQSIADSLTQPLTDTWLRFEGLNTMNANSPVIVDVFRFSTDPLKELALISDTFGQFVLEGAVLKDDTRQTGSKYFTIKKV